MKRNLVLLGPPGAGKGTVGSRMSEKLGLPLISSGDLLRENLKNKTERGIEAKKYMEKGELVPDEIVIAMIENELSKSFCASGVIMDGFPRTLSQARMLDGLFDAEDDVKVVYLRADDDFLVDRLSNRRVCGGCGKVYHLVNMPPVREGVCDSCGGKLVQRNDDREEIIRRRLEVYRSLTEPLIEYYTKKNLLHVVPGDGKLEDTLSAIAGIVKW